MSDYSNKRDRFFAVLDGRLMEYGGAVKPSNSGVKTNWRRHNVGMAGFHLASAVKPGEMKAEFVIDGKDVDGPYRALQAERAVIEREFGGPLTWFGPDDKARRARITVFSPALGIGRERDWGARTDWLVEKLDRLHRVFVPRVERMILGER